uniref:Ig-like domain-containing protein n=1 Tax=Cyprinodon variegatus TaxID=28743 RepID=A0A3Q2EBR5_CYPVA
STLLNILFALHGKFSNRFPVITVQLGEPITLTCHLTGKVQVHWYKQSVGNTLQLIAKVYQSVTPIYAQGFSASRFEITYNENKSNLIILSTVQQDEGMYHCAHMDWTQSTWTGTYLTLRGTCRFKKNKSVSDPTGPTNLETLQCSVLSYSENRTCSGEPSVFWFRTRSETSYPDVIYIDEKRNQNCEKQSNNQKKCGYNFSKNVSSSEADTYYCAVATCGEIIFGNGTKVAKSNQGIVHHVIYVGERTVQQYWHILNKYIYLCFLQQSENRQDLNYAALYFSGGKEQKGKKKREMKTEERIYSKVVFNSDI